MYAKRKASCSLYFYLKVLLLRWPMGLSPEFRQRCVCLPESFMAALMQAGTFSFGATTVVFPQLLHTNIQTYGRTLS